VTGLSIGLALRRWSGLFLLPKRTWSLRTGTLTPDISQLALPCSEARSQGTWLFLSNAAVLTSDCEPFLGRADVPSFLLISKTINRKLYYRRTLFASWDKLAILLCFIRVVEFFFAFL